MVNMKIVDSYWTPVVNILRIRCSCGIINEMRQDNNVVKCKCGQRANMHNYKNQWIAQHNPTN